jgi:hypothetical protein
MSTPNSACHAGPWLLDGQDALDIVAVNFSTRYWVNDGWFDAEEG